MDASRFTRKLPRTVAGCVACLAMVGLSGAGATQPDDISKSTGFTHTQALWSLSNVRMAEPGELLEIAEGTFVRQYVIEAEAGTNQPGMAAEADFRLAMDVFAPAEDMGSQKAGHWYVNGRWTLEPRAVKAEAGKPGALTGKMSGYVQADLPFDPTVTEGAWKGVVRIPMTRVRADGGQPGIRPVRGEGELEFDDADAGLLSFDVKVGPKL